MTIILQDGYLGQRIDLEGASYSVSDNTMTSITFKWPGGLSIVSDLALGSGGVYAAANYEADVYSILQQIDALKGSNYIGAVAINGSLVKLTSVTPSPFSIHNSTIQVSGFGFTSAQPCGYGYVNGTNLFTKGGATAYSAVLYTGIGTGLTVDITTNNDGSIATVVPHAGAAGTGYAIGDYNTVINTGAASAQRGICGFFKITGVGGGGAVTTCAPVTQGIIYVDRDVQGESDSNFAMLATYVNPTTIQATWVQDGLASLTGGMILYFVEANGRHSNYIYVNNVLT